MLVMEYKAVVKKSQIIAINEAIRTSQFVRNKVLRYWMDNGEVGKKELYRYNTQLRDEFKFVKALNSHACQASVENVERAINRFFDNCKKGKPGKKGYPKFKKHSRSVEYKQSGWKLHPSKRLITFTDKKGIGEIKLLGKWDIHRFDEKQIKRVRLVRRADGFYCQFVLDVDAKVESENEELWFFSYCFKMVGLDVGLEYFYSDSDGNHVENPRFLRKAEKHIKRSQRRIYKHKKGSNRRRKSREVYARKHLRVSRQRTEFAKRLALTLVRSNDLVAYEDLKVKNMVKNRRFAKSINDAAWSEFRRWVEYFAWKHNRFAIALKGDASRIAVPPHNTSQLCSNCGAKINKELKVRIHQCSCGCVLQRDVNAAINILKRATGGHLGSNAQGIATSTLLGESLVEQVATMN